MTTVKPKILLVDDDPDLLRLLSIRLQGGGYTVTAVGGAEAALSQVAVSSPDVVITDLRMGGMDECRCSNRCRRSILRCR